MPATAPFQAALKDPQVLADPVNRRVVDAVTGGGGLPKGALDDTSFLSQLDDRLARPFLQGFSSAIDLVFTSAALVLVFAFVLTLFLPEEKLRTMSGIQARRQQDEETAAAQGERGRGCHDGHGRCGVRAVQPDGRRRDGRRGRVTTRPTRRGRRGGVRR